jgi:predicted TPR repeat methyltransferase
LSIFNKYAEFYDALYADKDYAAECNFLEAIFTKYCKLPVQTILDLGCGTGGHICLLAQRGYTVYGVDQSENMLAIAREKKSKLAGGEKITLQQGDIRTVDLNEQVDVAVSMFAVMSYMVSNDDIQMALKTARRHLLTGGLFIFDVWHGPGVLTDPPVDRIKFAQKGNTRVIRFAHPITDIVRQTVDVNYKLLQLEGEQLIREVDETHLNRFFFLKEIGFHVQSAGFEILHIGPLMELKRNLTEQDWNLSVIAKAA